ncbi:helix-turn-helix domain-containing protein [Amedibacillus sp. YH-ame10]
MEFKRIAELREDNDMSKANFALKIGENPRTYRSYESGTRTMPYEVLIKIADYFNVSTDYLLERTDNKGMNK